MLCEKGHIAGEQSSRNWGWCRKMARDPREIPLVIESLRLWQGMNQTVEAETGFRTCGIMYLAETPGRPRRGSTAGSTMPATTSSTRGSSTAPRSRACCPARPKPWAGALYTPSDGKAEPQNGGAGDRRGGAAAWRDDPRRNARRAASRPQAGRVAAVVTEKGRIACQSVVLAGGAWSRLFCGNLGIDLPQLKVLGSVMRTERLDGGPEISASGGLFGYRKRMDGGYTVATLGVRTIDLVPDSFRLSAEYLPAIRLHWKKLRLRVGRRFAEEWRHAAALEPRSSPRRSRRCGCSIPAADPFVLDRARASIAEAFPAFRNVAVAESWGGMIDVMPDAIPVISAGRRACPVFHRDRLFRPRFRDRPGRRQAGCRHGHRRADRSSTRRRSACRASPTGRTRGRTRSRADSATPNQPAASFCRNCASSPATRPPLRWITAANSSRCVTFMLIAGDIDVGDLVPPAVVDEVPVEADRTAGEHDFAADDGFLAVRAGAVTRNGSPPNAPRRAV